MIETPFKLTRAETLLSSAATLLLQRLQQSGTQSRNISELCDAPQYGFTASASWEPSGPRLVRITDIKAGVIDWQHVPYCQCDDPASYALAAGDVLVARSGSVGKSFLVNAVPEPAVFASYMIRLRCREGTSSDYLYWCLQSQQFWQPVMGVRRGSAMKNINGKMLASLRFPWPADKQIQDAVVAFLNTFRERLAGGDTEFPDLPNPLADIGPIVARIEELSAKIQEARRLRDNTSQETTAVIPATGRKLFNGVDAAVAPLRTWLQDPEEGIQTGPFGAQLSSNEFTLSGVPVLTIGNIQYGGIKLDALKFVSQHKADQLERYRIKEGDLLFARMGTVGRCCIVPKEAQGWLINYHIIRVRLDCNRIEPRYVHWAIQTSEEIEENLAETIRGATRQGVNSTIVGTLPLRAPSLPEQRRIVAYLDDLQAKVNAVKKLQEETEKELDGLMPSILSRAFSGEL